MRENSYKQSRRVSPNLLCTPTTVYVIPDVAGAAATAKTSLLLQVVVVVELLLMLWHI